MADRITVLHLVAGTVVEETHAASRITTQMDHVGGLLQVRLWEDGRVASLIGYPNTQRFRLDKGNPAPAVP